MKTVSILALVISASALIACSASSGTAGEAVGEGGTGNVGNITGSGGSSGTTQGGTAGTIPGGTAGTIPTSGSGGTAGDQCGVQMFNLERKPAEVLLVLDRSASMKDPPEMTTETAPKWDLIIPALIHAVEQTGSVLSWGLKVFPEDPDGEQAACSAGSVTDAIQVEIAENNAAAVVAEIQATRDEGDGTPTGDAMKQAVAYLQSRTGLNDYNRYILLATDGEPSCVNVTATTAGSEGQEAARPYAISAVTEAANAGFHTFVVGVGTNKETAKLVLNDLAIAGQEPAACANPLDDCFYLGNSQEQLSTDLLGIAQGISTCVFALTARPPDPDNTRVNLNTEKVNRDTTKTDGWDYQNPEQTVIEVYGAACDAVKASGAATVEILFGCPDIDVR